MITTETKLVPKLQKQEGSVINMKSAVSPSSNVPVIRRLPSAYAMMYNISVNEAIVPPSPKSDNYGKDIYVRVNAVLKRIKTRDIYLIEGLCDYINIYTDEKRYTIYSTMYGILERLPKSEFMRVHRSFIVRIDRIASVENNVLSVEMRCVPVSKTYKSEVMSRLNVCC